VFFTFVGFFSSSSSSHVSVAALKRRLSRAQNTVFCGRILMFLASVTPLSDKSGVNLMSSFNTSNITEFEETADNGEPAAEKSAPEAATTK
jgi:hypothetical protein